MFQRGRSYSRDAIHAEVGGSKQGCLPTKHGVVVAVCFVREKNPDGPEVILVGRGPQKEAAATLLAKQAGAVPVFVKVDARQWQYLGLYKGRQYDPNPDRDLVAASGRTDVVGILRLVEVTSTSTSQTANHEQPRDR